MGEATEDGIGGPTVEPADGSRPPSGRRSWLALAVAATLVVGTVGACVVLVLVPRQVERAVRQRLEQASRRAGLAASIGEVEFRWTRPLVIRRLALRHPAGAAAEAAEVSVSWSFRGEGTLGRLRAVAHRGVKLELPGGFTVPVADSAWALSAARREVRLQRRGAPDRLRLSLAPEGKGSVEAELLRLDLGRLLRPYRLGRLLLRSGEWSGRIAGRREPGGRLRGSVLLRISGAQLPSLDAVEGEEEVGPSPGPAEPQFGAPLDVEGAAEIEVVPSEGRVSVPCWRLEGRGLSASGSSTLLVAPGDVWLEADVPNARLDLGRTLSVSGIPLPEALRSVGSDLGSVAFSGRVAGRAGDPGSVEVVQRIVFDAPLEARRALGYLNGPFVHAFEDRDGTARRVDVSGGSPDFVAFSDVPPVLVRALTLGEDADFWGHAGIDVAAIAHAAATNFSRGGTVRGGSTISQQLAKNLFLSRERTYGRKLQELALTFLLEAAVPKQRILEIYLNVIEWGPGVYGLLPAARHYFGKSPAELTPREAAFLVTVIPGPRKYQRSIAGGVLSTRLSSMVGRLLAKLRSVEAITDVEYAAAMDEELAFAEAAVGPRTAPVTGAEEAEPEGPPQPPVAAAPSSG